MRVVVSLPKLLVEEAEALGESLGISRDELYAAAIGDLLIWHGRDEWITRRINEVIAGEDTSVDPVLAQLQWMSLPQDDQW